MHGFMNGPPVDSRSAVMGLSRTTPLFLNLFHKLWSSTKIKN